MQEVPAKKQQKDCTDGACDPEAEAWGGFWLYRANDAGGGWGGLGGRAGRRCGLGSDWSGRGCWYGGDAGCWWLRRCCAWVELGCDLGKTPGSADAVGDDLVEGSWQGRARGKGALPGERLEEDDG